MTNYKRLLLIAVTATMALCSMAQGLYIGGHKAVRDNLYGLWLCSIPQDCFGNDWTAVVELDSTWTNVTINDVEVANGDIFTFDQVEGNKNYSFAATDSTGATIQGNITFTFLPVLELNGDFGYEYVDGTVSLNAPDTSSIANMSAKLKWRGNYTNGTNKHKRNYHIKFLDENGDKLNRKLLGLRKDNHWKLDAGQMELLRVRNRVLSDLWIDMSAKPWYQELEPKAVNGSNGVETEVILNGKYHGIYGLIEPVDRKQLRLVKHDTINNVFHGQLWTTKLWTRTATMSEPAAWDNNSDTWDGIELSYPDADDVMPTDWSTLADAVWFVNNCDLAADYQMFEDSIGTYFDMPLMVDYYIFITTLQIIDNESKNIFYGCYDKEMSRMLTMTPWDMDLSVGAPVSSTWSEDKYSPERPVNWVSNLALNLMFHNTTSYHKQVIDRYWELRETYLNTDSLIARFQNVVDQLEQSGAATREEARWTGDTDIWGRTLDISAEMEYVADWLTRRMAFADEYIFPKEATSTPGDVNMDESVDITDVTALIDYLLRGNSEGLDINTADVNQDGEIDIADVTSLIDYLLTT